MIKYNSNTINDWYFAEDNIVKLYRNGAVVYYKVITSGDTPTQVPCYAVVDNISQYSETEFIDVYNKADGKWYKLNNLNQYEEYGVYGDSIASGGTSRLPQGYTEVEYIQNNTQGAYINMGLLLYDVTGNSFSILAKLKSQYEPTWAGDGYYLQTIINSEDVSSPYYGFTFRYAYQTHNLECSSSPSNHVTFSSTTNTDGTSSLTISCNSTTVTSQVPLELFASYNSNFNTPYRFSNSTIYSFQVTKNNSIVRDLVPCKRDSDSMVGFYDLANDVFYYPPNYSSYQLVAGSAVTPTAATYYEGKLAIVDGYEYQYSGNSWVNVGEVSGTSRVPQGYTELEYIENVSGRYAIIDTSFKPNQDTRIVTEMQTVTTNTYARYIGAGKWDAVNGFQFDYETNYNGTLHISWGSNTGWTAYNVSGDYNKHKYDWNKNYFYRDDTLIASTAYTSFQCTDNLGIFNKITVVQGEKMQTNEQLFGKLYSFQMYDNNTLIRDLVPAKRNSDNMVGCYDIVNNQFYYSNTISAYTNNTFYQFVAGDEASGQTIYPIYYDVIQDPPNNLSFSSMTEAEEYECPWVGMEATIDGVGYIFSGDSTSGYEWVEYAPPIDYTKEYLTFEPISSAVTFAYKKATVNYSLDSGTTWNSIATSQTVTVNVGQKIMWKATLGTSSDNGDIRFASSGGTWKAYGNLMSMQGSDNFSAITTINNNTLHWLFYQCSSLVNIDNLKIPVTSMGSNGLRATFRGCGFATVPSDLVISATSLGGSCYMGTFEDCVNLTAGPILPATTIPNYGYFAMFNNCPSLTACTCLATSNIGGNRTQLMLNNVAATGIFYKHPNATWSSGQYGYPSTWTVEDYQG